MDSGTTFYLLTVGMSPRLVRDLWDRIATHSGYRISHLAHPSYDPRAWERELPSRNVYFFREDIRMPMPPADRELLASLELEGVPTIHNMIMSDRLVSRLPYDDAIAYATLLTQRLISVCMAERPDVIIGGFDGLHGSLGFAVARRLRIPWFVLHFSSMPRGEAAFCSDLSPASRVVFNEDRAEELQAQAEKLLADFQERKIQAAAYIPPRLFSASFVIKQIPSQLRALMRVLRRRRLKMFLKYTDYVNSYSLTGLLKEAWRLRKNLWVVHRRGLLEKPIEARFAFFGLHVQPESSIDVFAHFFSNQAHVIELMARSLPPTHSLLVKLHKSDAPNYSSRELAQLSRFPGVKLVSPYADTFEFIRNADLVFSIQGTIGLEGALLGKPVIMFGDSPVKIFPSVATVGKAPDLPKLVRAKLAEEPPSRAAVRAAFAAFLAPFYPTSGNDWNVRPTDSQIEGYVRLFDLLRKHCDQRVAMDCG
jgi:hypothetical protein